MKSLLTDKSKTESSMSSIERIIQEYILHNEIDMISRTQEPFMPHQWLCESWDLFAHAKAKENWSKNPNLGKRIVKQ